MTTEIIDELISRYLPNIESNIYYKPEKRDKDLMATMIIVASNPAMAFLDEEAQKAYKIIDILLEYGYNPTKKIPVVYRSKTYDTPLALAEVLEKDGWGKVYTYIINKMVGSSLAQSATEAPQVLKKIGNVLREVGGLPKKVIQTSGKVLSGLAGKAYDHSKEHKEYLDDQEKFYEPAKQSQKVENPTANNLNEGIKNLTGAERRRYIIQNLPQSLRTNLKDGLDKVVETLSNETTPYSSTFWKSLQTFNSSRFRDKANAIDIAFNGRNSDWFIDQFSSRGAEGLNDSKQLKAISFFRNRNLPIEGNLVKGNNWKSFEEMAKWVNENIVRDSETGEYGLKGKMRTSTTSLSKSQQEVFDILTDKKGLNFGKNEVLLALKQIPDNNNSFEMIKKALQLLGKK